jgi:hypothetical protein
MNAKLRQRAVLSEGLDRQPDLPLGDIPAAKQKRIDQENQIAAPWFEAGVGAYGKAHSLASALQVSENHVSDMRHGERTVPLRALIPLLKDKTAAMALLGAMADFAGLSRPQPIKVELTPQERGRARRAYIRRIREISLIHSATRKEIADEMGVDEERLESAFDEVTGVHDFAAR